MLRMIEKRYWFGQVKVVVTRSKHLTGQAYTVCYKIVENTDSLLGFDAGATNYDDIFYCSSAPEKGHEYTMTVGYYGTRNLVEEIHHVQLDEIR